jgi:hypothetical protein
MRSGRQVGKTLPDTEKIPAAAIFSTRISEKLQPEPGGGRTGIDDFGTVLAGGFSPARFFTFKESQGGFPAPIWGNRIGELLRKKQGRSRMGPASVGVPWELFA